MGTCSNLWKEAKGRGFLLSTKWRKKVIVTGRLMAFGLID